MSLVEVAFTPFPKMPRLRREIIITEKIDGTNASIYIGEDGSFLVGSRTRWITRKSDNFGFANWAYDHEDALREFLGVGHHFGEWWGVGIQRGYGLHERRFSLFNTNRYIDGFLVDRPRDLSNVELVPIIYTGPMADDAIDCSLNNLRDNGSFAAPGYMSPEGVVVFHKASQHVFKVMCEGDEESKGEKKNRATA